MLNRLQSSVRFHYSFECHPGSIMRRVLFWIGVAASITACQPFHSPATNQGASVAAQGQVQAESITQIVSPNAYKVPYLGYNGRFLLNADQETSMKDPRNPKRIEILKMETISFYNDTSGKQAIARNCKYTYMGAAADPKYYQEFKATWDLFELTSDEQQDPNCKRFHRLVLTAPHGASVHMHVRYGGRPSSFATLLKMSSDAENAAQFSPWFATYCGDGKPKCGKG